ncbi:MAG: hypothetical protein K0U60_06625 [Actinomycetia bacterium]|nr:hypothetical protein [Actinomycetes bacterium]MCH9801412.1 hypothetical protein [Actinomycetes bacterium]
MIRHVFVCLVAVSLWFGVLANPAWSDLDSWGGVAQASKENALAVSMSEDWIDPPPPPKSAPQPTPDPTASAPVSPAPISPSIEPQPQPDGALTTPPQLSLSPPESLAASEPEPAPRLRLLRTPLRPYRTLPSPAGLSGRFWRTPLRPG